MYPSPQGPKAVPDSAATPPSARSLAASSAEVAARLLADAGVAALAGTAFGPCGEGFVRFSYANSVENIKAALEAIRAQLI